MANKKQPEIDSEYNDNTDKNKPKKPFLARGTGTAGGRKGLEKQKSEQKEERQGSQSQKNVQKRTTPMGYADSENYGNADFSDQVYS